MSYDLSYEHQRLRRHGEYQDKIILGDQPYDPPLRREEDEQWSLDRPARRALAAVAVLVLSGTIWAIANAKKSAPTPVTQDSQAEILQLELAIEQAVMNGKIVTCTEPAANSKPSVVSMYGEDALHDDGAGTTEQKVSKLALELRAGRCQLVTPSN